MYCDVKFPFESELLPMIIIESMKSLYWENSSNTVGRKFEELHERTSLLLQTHTNFSKFLLQISPFSITPWNLAHMNNSCIPLSFGNQGNVVKAENSSLLL